MDIQYSTQQITFQALPQKCLFITNAGLSNFDGQRPGEGEVEHCREWIKRFCRPRKSINYSRGSYSLKHAVENWRSGLPSDCKYVSNGAMIEAAISLGYQFSRSGLNANFNMSILDKELYI